MRPETGLSPTQGPVARIRNGAGAICGTGLLIGERHVMTCAHVIDDAVAGRNRGNAKIPEETVTLDLPFLERRGLTARVVAWHPMAEDIESTPVSDIAVLELEAPVPGGLDPREAVLSAPPSGTAFTTLGFPGGMDGGAEAQGELRMRDAGGWRHVQDTQDHGYFVAPGFSGAPVFDAKAARHGTRRLLGMVVAVDRNAAKRLAFVIPTPTLGQGWPLLVRPYKGLFAFEAEDAEMFFGRETFIAELREKIERYPVLSVIGPSGAGKSSVVKAGLIPRLRLDGGWTIATCRPGRRPLYRMAHALEELAAAPDETAGIINRRAATLEEELRADPDRIIDHVETLLAGLSGAQRLLIVVDQFEELFTHDDLRRVGEENANDASVRQVEFIAALAAISRQSKATSLQAVLTLRADFTGRALQHRVLADLMRDADVKLGPMTQKELAEAVEAPAARLGVEYDPHLVRQIVDTTVGAAGSLPLLQFALDRLWRRQRGGQLTKAAYDEIGGVEAALADHAENVFASLNGDEQAATKRILTRLVRLATPGEQAEDTRAIVSRDEIGEVDWKLVQRLSDERLVVTGHDPATGKETAELVHEALISFSRRTQGEVKPRSPEMHSWDRLKSWLDEDRTFALWRQRLRHDVDRWSGKNDDALLRGDLLAEAERWISDRPNDLNDAEKDYIASGIAFRLAEEEAARTRARDDAEKERRQREERMRMLEEKNDALAQEAETREQGERQQKRFVRRLGLLALFLIVALLGAAFFGWSANIARNEAANERDRAVAAEENALQSAREALGRQLAAEAQLVQTEVPGAVAAERAAALTVEAWRRKRSSQAYQVASQALRELPIARVEHSGAVGTLAYNPNGTRLAFGSNDGTARILDPETGKEIMQVDHGGEVVAIAYSPDGTRLATGGSDGSIRLLNGDTGIEVNRVEIDGAVSKIAFSPDGTRLAVADSEGVVRILESGTGRETASLPHPGSIWAVAFTPDGTSLATASRSTARIFDAATGKESVRIEHPSTVLAIAFNVDGTRIATGGIDGIARIVNATTGAEVARIDNGGRVLTVAFSPDGARLITGGADFTRLATNGDSGIVLISEAATGHELARIPHNDWVWSIALSKDGTRLATGTSGGAAILLDASTGHELARFEHESGVRSIAFGRDGTRLATGSENGVVQIMLAESEGKTASNHHRAQVLTVALSPDGDHLATGGWDGAFFLFDARTGETLTRIEHKGSVNAVAFSPDSTRLAIGFSGSIHVINPKTGDEIGQISHNEWIEALAFSADGATLIAGSHSGAALFFDATTGAEISRVENGGPILTLALSRDGSYLATANDNGTVRLFETTTGKEISRIDKVNFAIAIAISVDAAHLAIGSLNGRVRLFEILTGQETARIEHSGPVRALAFSPSGTLLASGSDHAPARLFDVESGDELARLDHDALIWALAFGPDDRHLAVGSYDGIVQLFDADPNDIFKRLCTERVGRNLSIDEWRRYIGQDEPFRETCPEWRTGDQVSGEGETTLSSE